MEVAKLANKIKKRKSMNKGKLKKTIKNVLCRPDPILWPALTEDQGKELTIVLRNYKIDIPEFKKLPWAVLKLIAKDNRPKQEKIKKVEGLIFGITHCARAISNGECLAVILDTDIKPQVLVHHIIDGCKLANKPCICLKDLKQSSHSYFGFKTCCLGITSSTNVKKLLYKVKEFANSLKASERTNIETKKSIENIQDNEPNEIAIKKEESELIPFTYLLRTSKNCRAFIPPCPSNNSSAVKSDFTGQDFIDVKTISKTSKDSNYKNMIVKRISSNLNRKRKK